MDIHEGNLGLNVLVGVSSGTRSVIFGLSFSLHPYFVNARRECSDEFSGLFVPFRLFAWRYGAAPRRNNAKRKDKITHKRNNESASRNDEKRAQKDEKTPCEITPS